MTTTRLGLTDAQLALRRTGVSGTDIARICNLSDYGGPWDVWREKKGIAPPWEMSEAAEWGLRLQPIIAQRRLADFGDPRFLMIDHDGKTSRHRKHDWIMASLDYVLEESGAPERIIECKAPGLRQAYKFGDSGTDEVPLAFLAQGAWQMACTEIPRVDICVLLGGQDFRVYPIQRDLEFEGQLIERAERFYRDHIIGDKEPEPDASDAAAAYFTSKAKPGAELLPSTQAARDWAENLRVAKEDLAKAEHDVDEARNVLMAMSQGSGGIQGPDWRATWRDVAGGPVSYERKARRDFIVKFAKGEKS